MVISTKIEPGILFNRLCAEPVKGLTEQDLVGEIIHNRGDIFAFDVLLSIIFGRVYKLRNVLEQASNEVHSLHSSGYRSRLLGHLFLSFDSGRLIVEMHDSTIRSSLKKRAKMVGALAQLEITTKCKKPKPKL